MWVLHFTCMCINWSWEKVIVRKSYLLEAYNEFTNWTSTMGYEVKVIRTDAESVFMHDAFAKRCEQAKAKVSLLSRYQKETNGQTVLHFGVITDMTRAFLTTTGMSHEFLSLAVRHATCVKNRVPSAALGGRTPHKIVYSIVPGLAHIRILG